MSEDALDKLSKLRLESPTSPNAPSATQFNSDIQARILAFQQKRSNHVRRTPEEKPQDDMSLKPLPPLPPLYLLPSANMETRLGRSGSLKSSSTPASAMATPRNLGASLGRSNSTNSSIKPAIHSATIYANSNGSTPHTKLNLNVNMNPNTPVGLNSMNGNASMNPAPPNPDVSSTLAPATTGLATSKPVPPISSLYQSQTPTPPIEGGDCSADRYARSSTPDIPTSPSFGSVRSPTLDGLKKKPSLSQRRGMKLDMGSLQRDLGGSHEQTQSSASTDHLPDQAAQQSTPVQKNSPTIAAGAETKRKLSERKKLNFKLNLNDPPLKSDLSNIANGPMSTTSSDMTDSDASRSNSNPVSFSRSVSGSGSGSGLGSGSNKDAPSSNSKPSSGRPLQGLFANYSKYIDIKSGLLNFSGKASLHSKGVDFLSGSSFRISLDELEFIEELGRGNYGTVLKVLHKPTGIMMAMKEVRLELDETKFTQILMELDILHKCNSPYIVDFYGAFFVEGAVYMCMEYMDGGSLDKISIENGITLEAALAFILESVILGLKELKDVHNIIHRDVKPTNILVNTSGKVKLCDFGVSGNLVASLAKTNIGCQSYMAPERIKSLNPDDSTYSVQSDIWSLGLTILEIAAGHYPYPPETYGNIFLQLSAIVDGEPPKLDSKFFLKEAQIFVKSCLNKNPDLRPNYGVLLKSKWLSDYRDANPGMDKIVQKRVLEIEEEKAKRKSLSRSNSLNNSTSNSSQNPTLISSKNPALPVKSTVAPLSAHGNRENVRTLLKDKVRAPALHRRGIADRRSIPIPQQQQSHQ